jgi:MFS family permease
MSFTLRKMVVLNRINELPEGEKKLAFRLYGVLDRIEWLTVAPLIFGLFAPFITAIVAILLKVKPPESWLWMAAIYVASYIVGVIMLKKLFFNPPRSRKAEELKNLLTSDHHFAEVLKTLKKLDPDIARNIRKFIPKTIQ